MPKLRGEDLRLVTGFRGINHIIVRPVYIFQTTEVIFNNISSDGHNLATMDVLSGYFQMELDKATSYMTTFITPWGKF